ncbi:MAG: hypothetical protein AAGI68_00100 [Planctomycetota bacterium]
MSQNGHDVKSFAGREFPIAARPRYHGRTAMLKHFASEKSVHTDPDTGAEVIRWTGSPARDNHLYFTTPSVTRDNRWLVIQSERLGSVNLFAVDRDSGTIFPLSQNEHGTQRSYCWPIGTRDGLVKASPALDPDRNRLFYVQGDSLWRVELDDAERGATPQHVWTLPVGWWGAFNHVSPDGGKVCVPLVDPRAFPEGLRTQRQQMDIGPRIIDALGLTSRLYVIEVATGAAEVVAEVPFWCTHVQFDPTGSGRMIFNQEGHRLYSHSRTWCLEPHGAWRPLYDEPDDEFDNHENWSSDGSMIVYHGARSEKPLIAARRWDGSLIFETVFDGEHIGHTTPTLDSRGFITDGGRHVSVFVDDNAGGMRGQRLCRHDCNQVLNQDDHVHPLVTPRSDSVVFASNVLGTSNVYEVDLA